jgi:hypothetical protein
MILAPTLLLNAGSGAAIARPTFSRDFAGEKTLDNGTGPAITFTRASNATFFDASGTLQTASNDAPRFDHSGGSSLGLLIEEARTNLALRSEEFATTWSAVNSASVTSNTSVAPSGATTADTISAALASSYIQQAITFTGDGSKAISLFIKAGTSTATEVQIRDTTANASRGLAAITWAAGVPSATVTGGSLLGLTNVGSGWYRLQAEAGSVVASNTNNFRIAPDTSGGNGNIIIWGAQAENGAFPTSYIPTTSAAATRAADSAIVTPISSFYNQAEGTLFAQLSTLTTAAGTFPYSLSIDDNTNNNRIEIYASSSSSTVTVVSSGASQSLTSFAGAITAGVAFSAGVAFRANDLAFSTNGLASLTDASVLLPVSPDRLRIKPATNGHIRKIAYWPRRLSNTLLQQLTT